MKSIVFSHRGKREVNQDFVLVRNINPETYLHLIVDGMGGYEHGEIAAKIVAESILTYLSTVEIIDEAQIQKAINKANLSIRQLRKKNNTKVGATVGGVILQSNQATCFWVGDVKIFYYKNNKLVRESTSHTLIDEVISNGTIKDLKQINKYKHVVTRSVQGDVYLSQIDVFTQEKIDDSDLFLICSDGVHDLYNGIHLQQILNTSDSYEEAFNRIEKRLMNEAKDNFSLITLQI
ncbi:PP2C family protein-serine/threonine phosphatase [Sinomicrobium weinanense]|uniref:Protein serine/threonine phosphatase 2C family protein n=1 Tax=Sinomicrobium weinanense TaxID=2842200 RepID=A0A926Q178_9FLAO|nr:protein phosphatase 2C domain-containing protein [Sinomicrobium weinanense]MBC9795413.1 protein serine/threonine phosphatase 2C family protein [Sinomicrobium weinanense]MBU3123938.1 protein phosphatase 2C domain-containing protein [Sinomicrobium weinanense]